MALQQKRFSPKSDPLPDDPSSQLSFLEATCGPAPSLASIPCPSTGSLFHDEPEEAAESERRRHLVRWSPATTEDDPATLEDVQTFGLTCALLASGRLPTRKRTSFSGFSELMFPLGRWAFIDPSLDPPSIFNLFTELFVIAAHLAMHVRSTTPCPPTPAPPVPHPRSRRS